MQIFPIIGSPSSFILVEVLLDKNRWIKFEREWEDNEWMKFERGMILFLQMAANKLIKPCGKDLSMNLIKAVCTRW